MSELALRREIRALRRFADNATALQGLPDYLLIIRSHGGYTVFFDRYALLADCLPDDQRIRMNNSYFDVDTWERLKLSFELAPGHEREHWYLFWCLYRVLMSGAAIMTEDGPCTLQMLVEDAADLSKPVLDQVRKGGIRHVEHV